MPNEPVWRLGDLVMTWREDETELESYELYLGNIRIGGIYFIDDEAKPWHTWINIEDEESVEFLTKESAQSALVEAVVKALLGDAHDL